jgi:O-antigen/teichoic acid export membrane protein
MPTATRLATTGDARELERVFFKWSKICLSIVLMIGLYLAVLGPDFLAALIPATYVEASGHVLRVLAVSFLFYLPVRGVALPLLMGLGKPRAPALAQVAMGAANVAISLALVRSHGILGVALGTAIPNVAFAAVVLVLACRELGVGVRDFLAYVAGRATFGALVPLAFLVWAKVGLGVEGLQQLVATGVVMVVLFALVWVGFVYRDDPYLDLRVGLGRMFGVLGRKTP